MDEQMMVDMLGKLEWSGMAYFWGDPEPVCPLCNMSKFYDKSHNANCNLRALLDAIAMEED